MIQRLLHFLFVVLPSLTAQGQTFDFNKFYTFTEADTLRGALRAERTCFDVSFYDLYMNVDLAGKSIAGSNSIHFKVMEASQTIQIDFFANMVIQQIRYHDNYLAFRRKHNAVFIDFPQPLEVGKMDSITIYYKGIPTEAMNPPWDGGFSWKQDAQGRPWVGVSCEGVGASLWWPNKDHLSDEPDSMRMSFDVPMNLVCISNGRLVRELPLPNNKKRFVWAVSYPINNYNITLNIGHYAHFSDRYNSHYLPEASQQAVDLDYYVLDYNLAKARKHFEQTKEMLRVYEKYVGFYPFPRDGYALVETPYAGMEHQGAIAYGNDYLEGYGGNDPLKLKFDYIILHETGHEWFGNAVSCRDLAEMWIHESFTTYLESVYVEELHGKSTALRYINFYARFVENRQPMIGPYGVNFDHHGTDIYYKGALFLNTLRFCLKDDKVWWAAFKSFYQKHSIGYAHAEDFLQHINQYSDRDFTHIFEQYLHHPQPPTLVYSFTPKGKDVQVRMRWESPVTGFIMPVQLRLTKGGAVYEVGTQTFETLLKGITTDDISIATDVAYFKTKRG